MVEVTEGTREVTLEEVDLSEFGLGIVEASVVVEYTYTYEPADLREIGYSRGTPASGEVTLDKVWTVGIDTDDGFLNRFAIAERGIIDGIDGIMVARADNDGLSQVILEDLS